MNRFNKFGFSILKRNKYRSISLFAIEYSLFYGKIRFI